MDAPDQQQDEGRPLRPGPVIGGLFLGFAATWLTFAVVLFAVYANYGDSTGTTQDVVVLLGLVGLPAVLGLLLVPRRTRHWGAGLLMGAALGSISAAGVCGGLMGLNAV